MVIIAVKTKARLKSKSNITIACLASADLIVGIVVQPLMIVVTITTLQEEVTSVHCNLVPRVFPFEIGRAAISKEKVLGTRLLLMTFAR